MARAREQIAEDQLQEIARLAHAEVSVSRIAKVTGISEYKIRTRLNEALDKNPPINCQDVECVWPGCEQRAMVTGKVCYCHRKRADGHL